MLNQIQVSYPEISNTIYVVVRNSIGKVWNTVDKVFETWADGSIGNYDVVCIYEGGNLYSATFPAGIPSGYYTIQIVIQAGASPSANDLPLDGTLGYWDKANGNIFEVRVDALIDPTEEKFKSTAIVKELVNIEHETDQVILERDGDPTFPFERGSNPTVD